MTISIAFWVDISEFSPGPPPEIWMQFQIETSNGTENKNRNKNTDEEILNIQNINDSMLRMQSDE